MKIQNIKIDSLIPYDKNPRNNNESISSVMNSIKEFGFQQPIVVTKKRVVIIGHTRLLAAKNLKMKEVPVLIADGLSHSQVKALRLVDNKTGEKSFWDTELLRDEISDLAGLNFDIDMKDFGFEDFELNSVFGANEGGEGTNDTSFDESDDELPPLKKVGDSLKIRFENKEEKYDAYTILGVDPKKSAVDWADVKRALNL